jgi:hypothetical protein
MTIYPEAWSMPGQHQFPTLEYRPETGTWQPQEKPNHDQINRLLHCGFISDGRNIVR